MEKFLRKDATEDAYWVCGTTIFKRDNIHLYIHKDHYLGWRVIDVATGVVVFSSKTTRKKCVTLIKKYLGVNKFDIAKVEIENLMKKYGDVKNRRVISVK